MLAGGIDHFEKPRATNSFSIMKQLYSSYMVQRIVVAGIIFLSSLVLAKTLGTDRFGQVAYYMYLIKFLLSGQFGSESGFLYQHYSVTDTLNSSSYLSMYSFHLWLIAILVCLASIFLGSVYFFAAVGFALLVPFFSAGPILRINRRFGSTLLPDLIASLATMAGGCAWRIFPLKALAGNQGILLVSVVFMIFSYPILYFVYKNMKIKICIKILKNPEIIRHYFRLIRDGIPIYLATLAYMVLLMVDRFFLERYHSHKSLSLYMLAFQLGIGASLPLSAQNLVSTIDIGETNRDNISTHKILHLQLSRSITIGVLTYFGLVAIAFVLEKWYLVGYAGLTVLCASLGFGLILLYISGSVTPILFYHGKQGILTWSIIFVVGLSIVHNLLVIYMKWPSLWVAFFTAGWLGLYALFAIYLSWNVLKKKAFG